MALKLKSPPVNVTKINEFGEDLWFFNETKPYKEAFKSCSKYKILLIVLPNNGTDNALMNTFAKKISRSGVTNKKAVWVGFARRHIIEDGMFEFLYNNISQFYVYSACRVQIIKY